MKIFEIVNETGEPVEVDENGNPIAQSSSSIESPSGQNETTQGHYEPPRAAFPPIISRPSTAIALGNLSRC
ncbi:hypothetical protein E2P81_ATG05559 [Venturia nashicola]|uniref:Uncharacterized protein n=1 Tax=Venturia nashicola TaxID=86259 RepID=A0A4Z1P130_9PEZI|nr:hypothetical protein E6O75_ATG05693 [Venturia nashicola]TLD32583.1 hypothetical protein E2P81_ATG05559 [Venturia nashicola]